MTIFNPTEASQVLLLSGEEYFNALLEDINNARFEILLESYIFSHDRLGRKVTQALCNAAKRGVVVKVMVDGVGTPLWAATLAQNLEEAGVQTRVYHAYPWSWRNWHRSLTPIKHTGKWLSLLKRINKRNHRKTCIIDEHIVFAGSFNISASHLPAHKGGQNWHDAAVKLPYHNCQHVKDAFLDAWQGVSFKNRLQRRWDDSNPDPMIRLNNTRYKRRMIYRELLGRIKKSERRIWITNAYFVPSNRLLSRLIRAARRGVDVQILLPKKSDIFYMPWASSAFYLRLLKAQVRIFEFDQGILHAKTIIIDDWMQAGSSNLNSRSLLHDLEIDITLKDSLAKQQLIEHFVNQTQQAHEVDLQTLAKQAWYKKLLGRLALIIRHFI